LKIGPQMTNLHLQLQQFTFWATMNIFNITEHRVVVEIHR